MEEKRKREHRRQSDLVLFKVIEILSILVRISRGEEADYGEAYADLVGMRDKLGRRREDRMLAEELCSTVEAIARNMGHHLHGGGYLGSRRLRKVRLTKVGGGGLVAREGQGDIVGWEERPPTVRKKYRIFLEDGNIVSTSSIIKTVPGFIQTKHTLYQLEVIEEGEE
jgi:hypothetical protein